MKGHGTVIAILMASSTPGWSDGSAKSLSEAGSRRSPCSPNRRSLRSEALQIAPWSALGTVRPY